MFRAEVSADYHAGDGSAGGPVGGSGAGRPGATAVILTENSPKTTRASSSKSAAPSARKTVFKTAHVGSVWRWSTDYQAGTVDGQLFPVWLAVASDEADGKATTVKVGCEIGIDGWLVSRSVSTIRPDGTNRRAASLCSAQSARDLQTSTQKMTLDGPWKNLVPPSHKRSDSALLGTGPVVEAVSDGDATVVVTGTGLSSALSSAAGARQSSTGASSAFPLVATRFTSKWSSTLMPPDQLGPFTVTVTATGTKSGSRSAGCSVTYGDRTLVRKSAAGSGAQAVCTYSRWNQ